MNFAWLPESLLAIHLTLPAQGLRFAADSMADLARDRGDGHGISHSSSEHEGDFNPPEQYPAQGTVRLFQPPAPVCWLEMTPTPLASSDRRSEPIVRCDWHRKQGHVRPP